MARWTLALLLAPFVNNAADGRLLITGDLTMRGKTKRITIPARLDLFAAEPGMGA